MKFLKAGIGVFFLYILLISTGSTFSSCTKKQIINDTTIIRDTTTINHHDTTVIVDSIYDLKDGLVAYYNFNGGSLMDSSGFGNNIVFNNATPTADRFGRPNNAYLFNGTSNYMRVANSYTLNPSAITMMAIVKIGGFYTGNCHENQILGKLNFDPVDGFYVMRFTDFTNECTVPSPDTSIEQFYGAFGDNLPQGSDANSLTVANLNTKAQKGQWYNVVFTYDGATAKIYINGVLEETEAKTVTFTPNNYDVYIGASSNPTFPFYFNGVIDEIRIYNRALPAGAVKQLNNVRE